MLLVCPLMTGHLLSPRLKEQGRQTGRESWIKERERPPGKLWQVLPPPQA